MSTDLVRHTETHAPVAVWDPFQLMDRLDEDALRKELDGIASTELVYVVKDGGQEVVGLSKVGVDECCMALVGQGQVIREEDLEYQVVGEGEGREALFTVRAARYAVSPSGVEVKLDQVIGVKRQPLFYEPAALSLDARAPSKKYRGKTYRDLLGFDEGREYLAWMAEHFNEPEIRDFVRAILSGEDVTAQGKPKLNPHWYEHGCMKAARNARFRLIPGNVRAQIIATAKAAGAASGQVKVVDRSANGAGYAEPVNRRMPPEGTPVERVAETPRGAATQEGTADRGPYAPTEKQVAFYQRLAESPVFTAEERTRALEWLATRATKATIKDQIDWLKRQVETRKARQAGESA
jgi:hypothetical protein